MKPIIAPSEPYVLLKLPKFAAYQENKELWAKVGDGMRG